MGLAKRVIPVLLMRHGLLMKGKQFDSLRAVGVVQQAAEIHQSRGVDELLVLDVAATEEKRGPDILAMKRLTEGCFMPVTVGGGITNIEEVRELLANGADKVVIGTAAIENPDLVKECADKFGSQAIVVAIDAVRCTKQGGWRLVSHCGKRMTRFDPLVFAAEMEICGAGELIVTNVDRDGTMRGYDNALVKAVAGVVSVPVIANGGAGSYAHMYQAIMAGASAVAAGALFQWTNCTPRGASEYLEERGIEVRL